MNDEVKRGLYQTDAQKIQAMYGDIIHMEHHVSIRHKRMERVERAAQFGAFAALTGHYAALAERARHTEEQKVVGEDVKELLDSKLKIIRDRFSPSMLLKITYFKPDELKAGGAYETITAAVKCWNDIEATIELDDGRRVPYVYVMDVEALE